MSSFKLCKCGSLANWNSYFGGYYCHNCGLILEDDQPDGGRGGHMMDIEKLIERLRSHRGAFFEALYKQDMDDAATALSTLQAENESLKEKLYDGEGVNLVDYWMQQAKIEENGHRNCQAENEKLRAELEQVKLVRCKDCKMSRPGGLGYVWCGPTAMPLDGFCSNGQQKED